LNAELGSIGEGSYAAVKSSIKGLQAGGVNAPGCGVLEEIPVIGQVPCWMIT
jgi:hypothetical protein